MLAADLSLGKGLPISASGPLSPCRFTCQANIVMLDTLDLSISYVERHTNQVSDFFSALLSLAGAMKTAPSAPVSVGLL